MNRDRSPGALGVGDSLGALGTLGTLGALGALGAALVAVSPGCQCQSADRSTSSSSGSSSSESSGGASTAPASDLVLPGAAPFDSDLAARLRRAVADRGPDHRPRTRHLDPDGSALYVNRLALQSSPYLLQHAHNPVNWYPWGDEAFETARRLNRPVLLSVGYSTCHWCHVMEEESFEDPDIAAYLNQHYVAIKVDREELPDVDSIYMAAVQRMTGGGGWPMTVWLTADRQPFYGGTYFPPRTGVRGARIGFLELLQQMNEIHESGGSGDTRIADVAERLVGEIRRMKAPASGGRLDRLAVERAIRSAFQQYRDRFDPVHGGLRGSPKFPSSLPVRLLLRYHRRTGDPHARRMAELTLEKMAAGGIYDQVAGGFHRYAVDERWLVPHFEKMLYDNALLVLAYLEGYQVTGRDDFAEVARDILRYVDRDMSAPGGAFHSATDADSLTSEGHREEGVFFTWTPDELAEVLDPDSYSLVRAAFAVTEAGNFEGRTILSRPRALADVASDLGLSLDAARTALAGSRDVLYRARERRPPPLTDDKIMLAWNGLMISAFARAGLILGHDYTARARRAADFALASMRRPGGMARIYKDGRARIPAYLQDYAFFTAGLLDLFEATGKGRYVTEAIALDRILHERFEDRDGGAFHATSAEHDALLAREKPSYDGAIPSGNAVALRNLLRLYEFTNQADYLSRAESLLAGLSAVIVRDPTAVSEVLIAGDFYSDTPREIVVVVPGEPGEASARAQAAPFLKRWTASYQPNAVLVVIDERQARSELRRTLPLIDGKIAQRGEVTAYVCERQRCKLPTRDPVVFAQQIARVSEMAPQ